MKKMTYYGCTFLIWIAACLPNAYADFTLSDSDGDAYYIGEFYGKAFHNESYYVRYVRNNSFIEGDGFLYYDDFHGSLKIIIFETGDLYGFTVEGHWNGNGSEVYLTDSAGDTSIGSSLGALRLYMGNPVFRNRSKNKNARIKNVLKNKVKKK